MHANNRNIGTYAIGYKCKTKQDTFLLNRGSDFKSARGEAKVAGELLGYVLATRYPFLTQSVSFIGHSLGCQVIKSCLKALHTLQANDIVENVTFMAGACTLFDLNKSSQQLWASAFSNCVNGIVRNVHTSEDYVLLLFKTFTLSDAIGRSKIFVGEKATENEQHVNAT